MWPRVLVGDIDHPIGITHSQTRSSKWPSVWLAIYSGRQMEKQLQENIHFTMIESVANKYTFVWKGSVEKNKVKLIEKVKGRQ